MWGEYHPREAMTFSNPGQPAGRGKTLSSLSSDLLMALPVANPTRSQRAKKPLDAVQTGQVPGAESRVTKGRKQTWRC